MQLSPESVWVINAKENRTNTHVAVFILVVTRKTVENTPKKENLHARPSIFSILDGHSVAGRPLSYRCVSLSSRQRITAAAPAPIPCPPNTSSFSFVA